MCARAPARRGRNRGPFSRASPFTLRALTTTQLTGHAPSLTHTPTRDHARRTRFRSWPPIGARIRRGFASRGISACLCAPLPHGISPLAGLPLIASHVAVVRAERGAAPRATRPLTPSVPSPNAVAPDRPRSFRAFKLPLPSEIDQSIVRGTARRASTHPPEGDARGSTRLLAHRALGGDEAFEHLPLRVGTNVRTNAVAPPETRSFLPLIAPPSVVRFRRFAPVRFY